MTAIGDEKEDLAQARAPLLPQLRRFRERPQTLLRAPQNAPARI